MSSDVWAGLNKKYKIWVEDNHIFVHRIGDKYATKYEFGEPIICRYEKKIFRIGKKIVDLWYPEFKDTCSLFDVKNYADIIMLNGSQLTIENVRWFVNSGFKNKVDVV